MKYLRYIVTTLIVTGFFGAYFYYLTFSGKIEQNPISNTIVAVVRPYPELTNPKEISLNCDYHGQKLSLNETLYGSLYEYYKSDPGKKSAYLHGNDKDFVYYYEKDNTIKAISQKIKNIGIENNLSGDQTLDLTACFLQGIPYDNVKAALILGPDFSSQPIESVIPRYPYESLYDNLGICTDKTYLGAVIMRELGYETAIMTFDTEKHMSLGVAVPVGYGSFGTNFGIMELTGNGFLVGDIPDLNASAGLAINNFQTLPQGLNGLNTQDQLQLGGPSDVMNVSEGLKYSRIIERIATRKKLEELMPLLVSLEASYKQAQADLSVVETKLAIAEQIYESDPTRKNYNSYLNIYNEYLSDYEMAQVKINEYNITVNLYNSYVSAYQRF